MYGNIQIFETEDITGMKIGVLLSLKIEITQFSIFRKSNLKYAYISGVFIEVQNFKLALLFKMATGLTAVK